MLCVQWKTPDDGQRNCLKHVEFYSKNKFEKLVHLVGFIYKNRRIVSKCSVSKSDTKLPLCLSVTTLCHFWSLRLFLQALRFNEEPSFIRLQVWCNYIYYNRTQTSTNISLSLWASYLLYKQKFWNELRPSRRSPYASTLRSVISKCRMEYLRL